MEKGLLLLTSTGFSAEEFQKIGKPILLNYLGRKVCIITTAAEGKEENKYSQLAYSQFVDFGFKDIIFFDLEHENITSNFNFDVIYVCGGNTFKLLHWAKINNLKNYLTTFFKNGGCYIGVSAGSMMITPSIRLASEIEPDDNEVGLNDFTGFGFYPYEIFPHYHPEIESALKKYEAKHGTVVSRITNEQCLISKISIL